MSDPITILIVDDHAVVRRGARAFLEAQPDFAVVGDAGSGGEAGCWRLTWPPMSC
jgi:DNA-binding NarL/FixJ family response regulator